jgi:hypothetical protein
MNQLPSEDFHRIGGRLVDCAELDEDEVQALQDRADEIEEQRAEAREHRGDR